ncbi:MAG TPA: tetratricopeptide repeat protein [Oligoflexus sp.]|uniref:tetratricopeptide repeat protein n=1 Tax=Oligoflexus sp. TaxID=1971216 RepID=UPI002D718202|nr:tetratricopeptide repeat protein [Oligoflexus sp.]HYX35867.1 tetratricopeptide repeat protein [Oligoflexus sp.]
MLRYIRPFQLLFACWLVPSCATGRLQLSSIPEDSTVQLMSKRGDIKSLGKTPLTMDMQGLFLNDSDFAYVRVEKDGYISQSFVIPRTTLPSTHEISVSLEQKPIVKAPEPIPPLPVTPVAVEMDKCSQLSKENMTRLSKGVAVAQSLILKRDFEVARVRVASLIADFPYISVLHDLQGNIYYLQKNYADAVAAYEKSLELEPENMETAFIVKRLRTQLGRSQ